MDPKGYSFLPRLVTAYRFSPTAVIRAMGVLGIVVIFGILCTQGDNRSVRQSRSAWGDLGDSEIDEYLSTERPLTEDFEVYTTDNGGVSRPPMKLLTLFTTFKPSKDRRNVYRSIIRNWGLMRPAVQPVLYATPDTDHSLSDYARQHGWDVYPVPRSNRFKTPFLKDMYLHAEKHYRTHFYGYSNGDLLFDQGLLDTLTDLHTALPHNRSMVVGRRTNYVLKDFDKDLEDLTTIKDFAAAQKERAESVRVFKAVAIDYFISNRGGVNWQKLPNFVIGRAGYDNYLIFFARKHCKAVVVDASRTIRALHLQGAGFKLTHRTSNDTDSKYNLRIIRSLREFKGPGQLIEQGNVNAAQLESRHRSGGIEFIPHRRNRSAKAVIETLHPVVL
ncbi:hypothetical protein CAPTEDRAFT_221789 [Capitella teleta]|uniref:Uncharacterized protein n=1 Tax=Capitella teleta TaxID=283909 RepID=R7T6Z6_CAPTE|nr:hypothetical protein CAPTEDRAFT_221789 [Capitella teleta]|eukprot:ELT89173.1 hypothetical protein CAPTEDRAFT_221789 [Capitella teleta]